LTLKKGLMIRTSDGKEIAYDSGTVKMKQMVVTYQFQPNLKWSDGQPVVKADFQLGYKNDCDPASGAVDLSTCQATQKVDFTGDTEYVVTYKPGYQSYLATVFASPFSYYPSHQVLTSDKYKGKTLNDVPTADWGSLPELSETPLSTGPYFVKSWEKGVKITLEANPYYWKGPVKIKTIVDLIVQDTNQAVAQLLTGDVDVVGAETLGAGAEVQTVLDAQKAGKPIQVLIVPTATWEHIDMQLFVP
jgi:ABC-type transport system substrate-binding protein